MIKFKDYSILLIDVIEVTIAAFSLFVFIYIFVSSPFTVDGYSMYPTVTNGDFILTDKVTYRLHDPKRGDIVVFKYDIAHDYIKRIIAIPHDTILLSNGNVYLNGKLLDESNYLTQDVHTYGFEFLHDQTVLTIPANEYFVMGDNRQESTDSRTYGLVEKKNIRGKALTLLYPFASFHVIQSASFVDKGTSIKAI